MQPQDATRRWPPPAQHTLGRQPSPPPQQRAAPSRYATPHSSVGPVETTKLKSVALTRGSFLGIGLVVLTLVSALPAWDALMMLQDKDYLTWGNRTWPAIILAVSAGLIVLFTLQTSVSICLWRRDEDNNTSQALLQSGSLFLILLGTMMVLVSFPIKLDSITTWNHLNGNCLDYALAREIHDEYESLLSLRQEPGCSEEYTIEACKGFHANPTTDYIKSVEQQLRCAGFCHDFSQAALVQTSAAVSESATPASKASLLRQRRGSGDEMSALQQDLLLRSKEGQTPASSDEWALPALFNPGSYTNACEKMVGRHMSFISETLAWQLWVMGFVLIIVSLIVALWDWITTVPK